MYDQILINKLDDMLNNSYIVKTLPIIKNNEIIIKNFKIKFTNSNFYTITDESKSKIIAKVYSKSAAIALVKNFLTKENKESKIKDLDHTIEKNDIDCMYYKNTIKNTKNRTKKFATKTRLEIAKNELLSAKLSLHSFIFDNR